MDLYFLCIFQIRQATVEKLIERLVDLRFLSIDFLNTFLLTYRVFTNCFDVLNALANLYRSSPIKQNMTNALKYECGQQQQGSNELNRRISYSGIYRMPSINEETSLHRLSATYEPKMNDYSKISLAPLASVETIKSNCKRIPEERLKRADEEEDDDDEDEDEDEEEKEGSKTPVNQVNHAPTLSTLRKSSNIVDDMVNHMTKANVTDGLLDVKRAVNNSDTLKKLIQDSKASSDLHLNKKSIESTSATATTELKAPRKSDIGLRNSFHRTNNFTESMLEKELLVKETTLASSDLSLSDSIDSASNMASKIVSLSLSFYFSLV